jgi:hypothetical protein
MLGIKILSQFAEKMRHKGYGMEVAENPHDGATVAVAAEGGLTAQRQSWEAHNQQSPVNKREEHDR